MKNYCLSFIGIALMFTPAEAVKPLQDLVLDAIVKSKPLYKKATEQSTLPTALVNTLKRERRRDQLANLQKLATLTYRGPAVEPETFEPHTKKLVNLVDYHKGHLASGVNILLDPHVKDRFLLFDTLGRRLALCMLTNELELRYRKYKKIWRQERCNAFCATFDPHRKNICALGLRGGGIVLWDLENNQQMLCIKDSEEDKNIQCRDITFDPHAQGSNFRMAAALGKQGYNKIHIYNAPTGELLKIFSAHELDLYQDKTTVITNMTFDPHHPGILVIATSYPARVYIIDLNENMYGCYSMHKEILYGIMYHPEKPNELYLTDMFLLDQGFVGSNQVLELPNFSFNEIQPQAPCNPNPMLKRLGTSFTHKDVLARLVFPLQASYAYKAKNLIKQNDGVKDNNQEAAFSEVD